MSSGRMPEAPPVSAGAGGYADSSAPPLFPIGLFLGLSIASWRRSGDILRDWGRELYTAWRLSESDLLYRDVESLFGPLSQSFNGAVFTAFGPGHSTLVLVNLVLASLSAFLLWDICVKLTDRGTANAAATVFIAVFIFGHLTPLGNYNFITPYAHEATHGTLLCLATVWGLVRWFRTGSGAALAVSGVAAGASWLTKPEIALAATAALVAGGFVVVRTGRENLRSFLSALIPALFLPVAVVGIAIAIALGPSAVPDALARPFASATASHPLSEVFYREGMGLDHPLRNTGWILLGGVACAGLYWSLAAGTRPGYRGYRWQIAAVSLGPLTALATVGLGQWRLWLLLAWVLPGVCLLGLMWLAASRSSHSQSSAQRAGLLVWIVLSMALLLKLGLRPRFYQYGFYLAFPATMLAVMLAVHFGPRWLESRGGSSAFARGLAIGCAYSLSAVLALASLQAMHRRTASVMDGRDLLHVRPAEVDPRTGTVLEVTAGLRPMMALGHLPTLSVVPEGASLNYWMRIQGGSRYPVLLPPEMKVFGEARILRDFERHPPEVIVALDRDMSEYGVANGGTVPGATQLSAWIDGSYCEKAVVRTTSSGARSHGATILSRKTASSCSE